MSSTTKYVTLDAELEYAKVFEDDRDMGNPEKGVDYSDTDGIYKATLILSQEEKDKAVEMGCPEKQAAHDQFKPFDREGTTFYKLNVRRPHLHPRFMQNDENGNPTDQRLVVGPPKVFDLNVAKKAWQEAGEKGRLDQYSTDWTTEDGLIGNGTKAKVKLCIQSGVGVHGKAKGKPFKRVELMGIGITDYVPYEASGGNGWE